MPIDVVVRGVDVGVRPVRLLRPFRFGAVTLTACPQLFVRARVDVRGRPSAGHAAEMMVPKWFDKRLGHSQADNVAQLVLSVERAAAAYTGDRQPASTFGLFERHYSALMDQPGATALTAAYGQAVLDRAVVDALCRALGVSFFDAAARNVFGLRDSALLPDLRGHDWDAYCAALRPLRRIAARHTIGMLDALDELPAIVRRHGHTHFKIKLGGDVRADGERLAALLPLLDGIAPGCRYTLDGNEQYADLEPLAEMLAPLATDALLYIEQPIARDAALPARLPAALPAPLLMDEADGTLDAFVAGHATGWAGVSSKSCKGLYKSIVNGARCRRWNDQSRRDGEAPRAFMSAEDLTCQAGLSVQQDLALASLLGLTHAERNGHHYGDGFNGAPAAEEYAFAADHPDLYDGSPARLRIEAGLLHIDSLFAPGYAHTSDPDMSALLPLSAATTLL